MFEVQKVMCNDLKFLLHYIRVFYKSTRFAILPLLPTLYSINFQFSSLFTLTDVNKCEIRCQWVQEDYISKL